MSDISLSSCKQKIEWLEKVNKELLEVSKDFITFDWEHSNLNWATIAMWLSRFSSAIAKVEGESNDKNYTEDDQGNFQGVRVTPKALKNFVKGVETDNL